MAKFITQVSLENMSWEKYRALSTVALEKMGASVTFSSASGLMAETAMSFSKNTWGHIITIQKNDEAVTIKSESKGSVVFDFGKNKRIVQQFQALLQEAEQSVSEEELQAREEQLKAASPDPDQDILNPGSAAGKESGKWWSIFIPGEGFFVTPILIDLNIGLFILMVLSSGAESILAPGSQTLINWGANYTPLTSGGQWWRLFTCTFEHIGIIHLLFNMYALLYVGIMLEPLMGSIRFGAAYIATGLIASLASFWWHDVIISAGASGAIFGMYGVFGALLLTNLIEKSVRQRLITSIGIFIFYNLAYGMKSGVDNSAHVGGLLSGFVLGFVFFYFMKKKPDVKKEYLSPAIAIAAAIVLCFYVLKTTRKDISQYENLMQQFGQLENRALSVYNNAQNKTDADFLSQLKEVSIPAWKDCLEVTNKISSLSVSDELKRRNNILQQYVMVRTQRDSLAILSVEGNTNQYDSDIKKTDQKIDQLYKELSGQ